MLTFISEKSFHFWCRFLLLMPDILMYFLSACSCRWASCPKSCKSCQCEGCWPPPSSHTCLVPLRTCDVSASSRGWKLSALSSLISAAFSALRASNWSGRQRGYRLTSCPWRMHWSFCRCVAILLLECAGWGRSSVGWTPGPACCWCSSASWWWQGIFLPVHFQCRLSYIVIPMCCCMLWHFVCMLKIPSTVRHTVVWTLSDTARTRATLECGYPSGWGIKDESTVCLLKHGCTTCIKGMQKKSEDFAGVTVRDYGASMESDILSFWYSVIIMKLF